MPFPSAIQHALQIYDSEKGFWRRLFRDQAAIYKIRKLDAMDQANLFKIYQCFMENLSKPTQASYQVYLAVLGYLNQIDYGEIPKVMDELFAAKLLRHIDLEQINRLGPHYFEHFASIILKLSDVQLLTQQNLNSLASYYETPNEFVTITHIISILMVNDNLNQENFNALSKLLLALHNNRLLTKENIEKLAPSLSNIRMFRLLNDLLGKLEECLLLTQRCLDLIIKDYLTLENITTLISAVDTLYIAHRLTQENFSLLFTIQPQHVGNFASVLMILDHAEILSTNLDQLCQFENQFLFSDEAYTLLWRRLENYLHTLTVHERQSIFNQIIIKVQQPNSVEEIENYMRILNLDSLSCKKRNDVKFFTAPSRTQSRDSLFNLDLSQLHRQGTL